MTVQYSLLFVEDEDDIRTIAELALDLDPRFVVTSFSSGEEAVEALTGTIRHFDLALIDMRMPGMDGLELMSRLKPLPGFGRMPIVIMTASLLETQVRRYEEKGAVAVIAKPFDPLSLAPQLIAILEDLER